MIEKQKKKCINMNKYFKYSLNFSKFEMNWLFGITN